jgi:hypothetical protein
MRSLAPLVATLLLAAVASTARAEVEGEEFTSTEWRIRLTAPKNWQLTEQTAYPNILLRIERRDPRGVILLAAERAPRDTRTRDYAIDVTRRLEQLGFKTRAPSLHATTGAFVIDFDNGKAYLRQAVLVVDGIGYSLTLSAPDARIRGQHLRAFENVLRELEPLRRTTTPPPTPTPAKEAP